VQIISSLQLIRFGNCLIAAVSVWVGAYLAAGFVTTPALWVTMAGVFCICAGGNIVNDIIDRRIDTISHPDRPIPAGKVSIHAAKVLAIIFHLSAMILIAFSNLTVALAGVFAILALLAYNLRLKRVPLVGNLIIAILAGLTLVCGGLAVDPDATLLLPGPIVAAMFAFFFHLIREIIKDIEDMDGDSRNNASSLALWLGVKPSLSLALLLTLIAMALTVLPFVLGWYGIVYLWIVLLLVDLPVTAFVLLAFLRPSRRRLNWCRICLKVGMVCGLAALVVA
jgi:geranylgeranylglycerol-phosphate geranylgeranyltransferase